jgi:RNase P subunit RPR2
MRIIRFHSTIFKDCETCFGEGIRVIGLESSFNSKTMEVEPREIIFNCQECAERSRYEYEYAVESQIDKDR